jgi:hypothetical protein
MQTRVAIALLRNRQIRGVLLTAALVILVLPVLVATAVTGLIDQEAESTCGGSIGAVEQPAGGPVAQGLYAVPLQLRPGRWYEVGATEYGGPGDPTSGDYGSIPDPSESYLPAHPDTFAELSVLRVNPANGGSFTFQDANALDNLPYLTGLRVAHDGHESLLFKRDTGYGQGPGQLIENGQPYRLDIWWQEAQQLAVSKSPVQVQLAPPTGTAPTLSELPTSTETPASDGAATGMCVAPGATAGIPLPLTPGTETKILPSGLAAAGEGAPQAVKDMVAAGNRLFGASYLYGGAHGTSLDTLQPAYDCSSAVSYLLHWGGMLGTSALDSTELETYGEPGPGQYISIYANTGHTFMYVAGLRFDTVEAPEFDTGPNSGKPGPKWRVSASVPDWATWTVRHPPGL